MKFRDFLREQKEKHAVLAFGRMNPITSGHEKLVQKVKDIADSVGGSYHIVLSHSQDSKKNPLTAAQKLKHAKRAFPGTNFSTSDKEHPTYLKQAEKLHKQGVTHLHMVGGSDRAEDFKKYLHQYNGTHKGALYNFKSIKVHSAGERDPDAEGTTGISASKMRDHATKGNFKEFRKGAPSTMSDEHAKHMYNDVRRGMNLKEGIELSENDLSRFSKYIIKPVKTEPKIVRKTNPAGRTTDHVEYEVHGTVSSQKRTFKSKKDAEAYYHTVKEETLTEGVHDKAIFKAVFLAGGPGSGKDYVLSNTLDGHGMIEINSDKAFEYLLDKEGLDKTMPDNEEAQRNVIRKKSKDVTEIRHRMAFQGRNGLIINGTGANPKEYIEIKKRLEDLGYDTTMVMVNTDDEVSRARNVERGQRGGRTVPENIRKQKWEEVQAARAEFSKVFRNSYIEFDNSEDLREAPPDVVKAKKGEMQQIYKEIQKFVSAPPKHERAKFWIATELGQKDTAPISKTAQLHPAAKTNDEMNTMGLEYYGFGRYGKNGKVTHRSIHDRLVPVDKIAKTVDTHKKKIEKSMGPTVKVRTDSNRHDRKRDAKKKVNEAFEDLFEDEKKKQKLMSDTNGKPRVFHFRMTAAKEAHRNNGIVHKVGKSYVVKIREDLNEISSPDNNAIEAMYGQNISTPDAKQLGKVGTNFRPKGKPALDKPVSESYGNGSEARPKITLNKIKENWSKKVEESIDKGIEPGISMAGAGESPARDMGEKLDKQGKATQVTCNGTSAGISCPKHGAKNCRLAELTGDETGASIGDQKEDELKKRGISLMSFKKKNYV